MNRRSFIQNLGLVTGGAFISLQTNAFSKLDRDKTIHGKVREGKTGIANVVISDGYSVVLTDKNGEYTISPNPLATTIFMSTPSGYAFKTDYSVAKQYETLGSRNQYDFSLERLKKDDSKHSFIIWADPQVKTKSDVKQMMDTSVPDVQKWVKEMGKDALLHGIGVGDLVWDNHALFADYNKAIQLMGIPFFQALGNHDQDYRLGGDETSDKTFKEIYGPTYYSFNRGKAHYVVLDDVRYSGKDRSYDGYIVENQLEWLRKDLQHVAKDSLLIIALHIPVHNSVKNNGELYAILEGYSNVHIMSGHTHYNLNVVKNGIYEHNHGTVCGAWWTGPICADGTPRGYGVYEVDGNQIKWYYKSTGQNNQHQVRASVETLTGQKRLIANVWNWDPEWKVEYILDGKNMGALQQEKGVDPLAVKLFNTPAEPGARKFKEPKKMSHLFVAHFKPEIKKVKVVVTDRFGNKYTADANA